MTRSSELLHSDGRKAIGQLLHRAITAAQIQQPQLLTEPCRKWLSGTSAEAQSHKINALLSKQPDAATVIKAVEQVLAQVFVPAFRGSKPYSKLLQRVQTLAAGPAEAADAPVQAPHPPSTRQADQDVALDPAGTGLLLVDAENMNPPEALETLLQTVAQYPLRYRLAFGNWRKLGDRDQELYRRGYQMVHVPSGKNSADIKMSLDAFLISLWNPSLREVFICSTDSDLLHLGHALLNLGIVPYRVSRRGNDFVIRNIATQRSQIVRGTIDATMVKMPSLAQLKRRLKNLILEEQKASPGKPITLGRLGKLFSDRNQVSVGQVLQNYPSYRNLKHFLEAQEGFELCPLPDGFQIEVRLTEVRLPAPAENTAVPLVPPPNQGLEQPPAAVPQPIVDTQTLEQALIKLLWSLSSQQTGGTIPLSVLSVHFAHVHQESLSSVLKRIGEPKGLPKFLAKCRSLRIHKQGADWQVAMACVS
ncbi:NYN domain-containing protein [Nodosilinea sp. LEGE 06152]|uniref:NYN domain-containing protein n=1 Tax=Nodosilinea sp. LEGE 06152 TaxID=2777966 RepID=UPI00187F27C2|nr:NYN domain-containing protein [Nodosilinea sp. LEGE 06152]MBE9158248.1 NYN domain-containing protein [Nodosilinea sp. LEGE 06152]